MLSIKNVENFLNKKLSLNDIKKLIKKNFDEYTQNKNCEMPNLIFSNNSLKLFDLEIEKPNFIGEKKTYANIVFIKNYEKFKFK